VSDAINDLRALLASRYGLLVVETKDEERLCATAREAAAVLNVPVWLWSVSDGLSVPGGSPQLNTREPAAAISFLRDLDRPLVAVMLDAQPIVDDPVALRMMKELAEDSIAARTVIVTGIGGDVPQTLAGVGVSWSLPPPSRTQMTALVDRLVSSLPAMGLTVQIGDLRPLVDAVMGLTPAEAERVILHQATIDGRLDEGDALAAHRARAELLSEGPLDLIDPDVTFADVGGLTTLKDWLDIRGRGFEPAAQEFGLDAPRGVLLAGVPGCGKSLIARAIAGSWRMSLAALDTGRLHGSLVGQSEQRLRDALSAAEAMTPLVLWIDEIEKAFGRSGDQDGGVAQRVIGTLLRWMQDRPDGVFVVATSNDVTALPAELTRKGRFDELFFVDLPDPVERAAILRYHLQRRHRNPETMDVDVLVRETDGFSGAEIESAVTSAMYVAYAAGHDLTTADLLRESEQTVPLSRTRAEDIARLRSWAVGRARMAGGWPPPEAPGQGAAAVGG
jgi:AAA+ superfamily predicted ATPase